MNKKQVFILALDILLLAVGAVSINFTYSLIENLGLRFSIVFLVALLCAFLLTKEAFSIIKAFRSKKKTLVPYVIGLLGEEEQLVRVWDLNTQIGILIGKNSKLVDADIDLSDAEFASYIDDEHATLNYTGTGWWLEDLGSHNGTTVKRRGKDQLLAAGMPSRVLPGDVILIGEHTRLAVN